MDTPVPGEDYFSPIPWLIPFFLVVRKGPCFSPVESLRIIQLPEAGENTVLANYIGLPAVEAKKSINLIMQTLT
ncbi:MAG: hypothetical protein QM781_11330 [Chitinophagaceae bacterium]